MTKTKQVSSAFQALDLPNADELAAKSRIVRVLTAEISKRKLTQKQAGVLLGLDQSNVSALVNEKISRFSLEKLMMLAGRLGFDVSIRIEGEGIKLDVPYPDAA